MTKAPSTVDYLQTKARQVQISTAFKSFISLQKLAKVENLLSINQKKLILFILEKKKK